MPQYATVHDSERHNAVLVHLQQSVLFINCHNAKLSYKQRSHCFLVRFELENRRFSGASFDLIGDPNCPPLLKATADFTGLGVIDGNKYGDKGLSYKAIGVFLRQIRNFVIDITDIPANVTATPTGIHWPMSQGTVIPNVVFQMSRRPGSQQQGIFMEEGSGGLMADLVFYGDWRWYYKSIHVEDCKIGVNMTAQSPESQNIGSISFVDSNFVNVETAFNTPRDEFSKPPTGGSVVIENVYFTNIKNIVLAPMDSVTLSGSSGTTVVDASGQGHYLKDGNKYFEYSRPSYAGLTVSDIVSVHGYGATNQTT
ncbi:pectate lyase superfamily protein-domain-containing protein [Phyllosticta citriasiana]|uniref:Pectate lyase superfamily protein-domain-containing protein n=1 Tax=Phyllosticta citriasiana TaxID=595635 RepID=A0ABR1KTE4_9PEZI